MKDSLPGDAPSIPPPIPTHPDNDINVSSDPSTGTACTTAAPIAIRPQLLLLGALLCGFVCELFMHGQPPGLGYAAASFTAVAIWLAMGRAQGIRPSPAGLGMLAMIMFCGLMVGLRASPCLLGLNILASLGLLLLMAAAYIPGRLKHYSLTDYALCVCFSGLAVVVQPFILLCGDLPKVAPEPGMRHGLASVLRGILLAIPILLVFGMLFFSADAVFAAFIRRLFDWIDLASLIGRLVLSLVLSWLVMGLARYAFTRTDREDNAATLEQYISLPFLRAGGSTAITVLALVNALFLAFVAVQAVYLFGGIDTLVRTGLSYSEYARSGFFELVTVAALVLSLILLSDWLVRGVTGITRRVIDLLHGLLVLLTLVILVSALLRMQLYTQEYGLTELRFYTTAFMAWLASALVWLTLTVMVRWPGKGGETGMPERRRFAFGAWITGLAFIVALNLLNPDAFITRTNLRRAATGVGQRLDAHYLAQSLSADAVPALLAGQAMLSNPKDRAALADGLRQKRAGLAMSDVSLDWRGRNLSTINALELMVASDTHQLTAP